MRVVGGQGGAGGHSFHSEPRKVFGGPDGGNGGDGGHVILKGNTHYFSFASRCLITSVSKMLKRLFLYKMSLLLKLCPELLYQGHK